MRAILALIGLVAIAIVVAMSLGMVSIKQTSGASLPSIEFKGAKAPEFDVDVGKVGVGTMNTTVEVPTLTTTNKTVEVPVIEVEKAEGAPKAKQ
jgi:hypothetical protein